MRWSSGLGSKRTCRSPRSNVRFAGGRTGPGQTRPKRPFMDAVSGVELAQITRDALLQLSAPPLHLRPCEVLVPVVHGFELAAIDGDARSREKAHLTTEFDEACTYVA